MELNIGFGVYCKIDTSAISYNHDFHDNYDTYGWNFIKFNIQDTYYKRLCWFTLGFNDSKGGIAILGKMIRSTTQQLMYD